MTGTRLTLPVIAILVLIAPVGAGPIFGHKPKLDAARVKQLNVTLRTDPDEKKRRAAVAELREADPRVVPEVIPTLIATLQRDASATVRAAAADVIGRFKVIYPLAGLALENAAESDPSAEVRGAAQQALWEYHLNGYRSSRGADGIAGQTPEPPLAKLPAPRPTIVTPPPPVLVVPIPQVPSNPPVPKISPPRQVLPIPVAPTVPPLAPPFVNDMDRGGIRTILTAAPPILMNVTAEPPLARPADAPPPPLPATTPAPRFSLPVAADLPPLSLPPDADLPSISVDPPAVAPLPEVPAILAPPLPRVPALPPLPVPPTMN